MLYFFVIILSSIGYAVGEPLHEAAKKGNMDQINRLIEKGVTVDIVDENSNTPLYIAVGQGHKAVVELLIRHGGESRTPWTGSPYGKWL
jgi:ankyrin repeat protein